MSDEDPSMEEGAPEPAAPAPRPVTARALGQKPQRPPLRSGSPAGRPPPTVRKGSKLKAFLMLGMIIACIGMAGRIGWKFFMKYFGKTKIVLDVGAEIDKYDRVADENRKKIEKIQNQVCISKQDIAAPQAVELQQALVGLQEASAEFDRLRGVLREKHGEDTEDWQNLSKVELRTKLWILDVMDLLELSKHAPEYGGLYIPMRLAMEGRKKAQDELKDIQTLKVDILPRNDPAEKAKIRSQLKEIQGRLAGYQEKLNKLNDYVREGLARPELTPRDVRELEELQDEANLAGQAFRATRDLLAEFRE